MVEVTIPVWIPGIPTMIVPSTEPDGSMVLVKPVLSGGSVVVVVTTAV